MNFETERSYNKKLPCYKKILSMNHCLICSVTIVIAVTLSIAFATLLLKKSEDSDYKICLSPGCVHAASHILKYMDDSANPCDDFYQFSCGRFLQEATIPEDKLEIGSFNEVSDIVRDRLRTIIEKPLEPNSQRHYQLLQKFYNICMNTSAIEVDGLSTSHTIFTDLGGWPLLEGEHWNAGKFEWKQSVYRFRKFGLSVNYLLSFNVVTDKQNSSGRIISLDQADLSFSREHLIKGFDEQLVKVYYDYLVDVAVLFGANRQAALRETKNVLDFEIALAKICLPNEARRNLTLLFNPMSVEDLQDRYPQIPWVEYLNKVLDVPDIEITEDEIINVVVPQYITDLEALLRRTSKRVQANYVIGRVALSMVPYLPKQFREREEQYLKILTGISERTPRWKECTNLASRSVYLASGASYVRKYFKEDAKTQSKELVSDIQNKFLNVLQETDWMDEETKQRALEKATSMTTHIGYPGELLDDKKLENYYLNLELSSENLIQAMMTLTLFRVDYAFKQLRELVNRTEWLRQPFAASANAFYLSSDNSVQLPAGILQGVFFSSDRPRYMNYGGIGYIIGHEITHGFDETGRQYDEEGNLVNWWTEDTNTAFAKKAQCIVDQYGNYTVPEVGLNLNGINNQIENIADNGGIKLAYLAYQSWVTRNGPEARLPGLPFTPSQMFWISTGNVWCQKYRNQFVQLQDSAGLHSPSKFRIEGSFRNSPHFAKDFSCPLGSNMNPVNKCKVW